MSHFLGPFTQISVRRYVQELCAQNRLTGNHLWSRCRWHLEALLGDHAAFTAAVVAAYKARHHAVCGNEGASLDNSPAYNLAVHALRSMHCLDIDSMSNKSRQMQ